MRHTIKAKNLDITPSVETYVEKKVLASLQKRLAKFSGEGAVIIDIELSRDTRHHKKGEVFRAEVNITIPPKHMLHSEAIADDIRSAIDLLEDAANRSLDIYKGKLVLEPRRRARKEKA